MLGTGGVLRLIITEMDSNRALTNTITADKVQSRVSTSFYPYLSLCIRTIICLFYLQIMFTYFKVDELHVTLAHTCGAGTVY